jgi:hypothetical protein
MDQRGGPQCQSAPPTGRQHHQGYTGHPASSGYSGQMSPAATSRVHPNIQMHRGYSGCAFPRRSMP